MVAYLTAQLAKRRPADGKSQTWALSVVCEARPNEEPGVGGSSDY